MKLVNFLLITACLATLTACGGEGATNDYMGDGSAQNTTRRIIQVTVASDGTLNYTGNGEFEGFAISASNPALAGRTIYIEKAESEYIVDEYVSFSSRYAVRFTLEESDPPSTDLYDAGVALPFSRPMMTTEGGTPEEVLVCGIANETVHPFSSSLMDRDRVQAEANIPMVFFSGYLNSVVIPETTGTIRITGRSYKAANEAGEYLTDSNGVNHPDTARGTDHVQPGERVMLAVNQEAFGESVTSSSWSLSAPAGSLSVLAEDDDHRSFIPDTAGFYDVTLEIEGINGKRSEETITIVAQNYSFIESEGNATCLSSCHDGGMASSKSEDRYGRQIHRDIVTPWSATAHSNAFTTIATITQSACLKCHSTGFLFADRDLNGIDDYVTASGFDDTITDWAAPAATGSPHLQGVTCEACHGPGSGDGNFSQSHYSETSITSDMCLSCHDQDGRSMHFFVYSDTHDNAHTLAGGNAAKNAECFKCHTGEGMMSRIFDADITPSNTTSVTGIGCPVCHDPHGEGDNDSQLRITGTFDIPLASGDLTVNAGKSLICYNCHNADAELPYVGTIPHNSQVEMLSGVGGYDYGENLSAVNGPHSMLVCNDCHMSHEDGTTHDMNMTVSAPGRIATCQASPCHTAAPPELSDGHYGMNGKPAGVRAGIRQLAHAINAKAGLPARSAIRAVYSANSEELVTALNRAAYNHNFILSDRSSGFHNPVYAEKLIELSLEDLGRH